jgi:hypothetical protein
LAVVELIKSSRVYLACLSMFVRSVSGLMSVQTSLT